MWWAAITLFSLDHTHAHAQYEQKGEQKYTNAYMYASTQPPRMNMHEYNMRVPCTHTPALS